MSSYIDPAKQVTFKLPEGCKFIVWLSHDVDRVKKTFFHAMYYAFKEGNPQHWESIKNRKNPYWNFDKILSIEKSYDVKSTFFFLNETMEASIFDPKSFILAKGRYKIDDPQIIKVIKEISAQGWEVGMHGSFLSYNQKNLLQQEKGVLEKITTFPIEGIRQHYLNLSIPETWEHQKSIGFKYDTSFGYNSRIGYKNDLYFPFRPFDDDFIVFPVTIMDKILFQRKEDIKVTWNNCLAMIDKAEEKNGFLSLLWHQRVFNDGDFPNYTSIYKLLIEECKKRGALFCTGKDIFNYIA